MSEKLDDILKLNALDMAEEITGKSIKDDGVSNLAMFLHMRIADRQRTALAQHADTYWGMALELYLGVVDDLGFEKVYEEGFYSESSKKDERFFIYAHRELGLILALDTYNGSTTVNMANMWLNWAPEDPEKLTRPKVSISGGYNQNPAHSVLVGRLDVRIAFRRDFGRLQEGGRTLPKWKFRPIVFRLAHHGDPGDCVDAEKSQERIQKLPQWVRDICDVPEEDYQP